ncbi:MAG: hypothetical protein MJ168_08425 [Clostridia bacterium]|nr:hypothetical protein [Clostridia bacterium]
MRILNKVSSVIDDTVKYQLVTNDGYIIEACTLFFHDETAKINICVSSQVGCACSCMFCATGSKRFIRNLTVEEITEQVSLITREISIDNNQLFEITYMGTGEPLNNVDAVFASIKYFEHAYINLFRINVSTILPHLNIPKDILVSTKYPIHFQYSMHFTSDQLREQYFRNKLVPLDDAINFFNSISVQTGEAFCINYMLFEKINDSTDNAKQLIDLCKSINAYIKISEYCPVENVMLQPSTKYKEFTEILDKEHICWKPFRSKGIDIKASCGHLLSDIDF